MKLNKISGVVLCLMALVFFAVSCKTASTENQESSEFIHVEYPETYELANIILALTEYGIKDEFEVRKSFDYYNKLQEYFQPVKNHPLLDSVNYSRKKWESYLSFRTDSYAFEFDENGQLKRKFDFYTNKGFQPFDDHLELINDFVKASNFRAFFQQNKEYYNRLTQNYRKTQYIKEMRDFPDKEFGNQYDHEEKYSIVLSPFVFRMNCHRAIDSATTADFITIPEYVVFDTIVASKKDIATSIHNLFTEMDHGYVNPTTDAYSDLVRENFDPTLWDNNSGYNENEGFGVFNEYMTWAVYDIFLKQYFPDHADEAGLNWGFQNDSRGFPYSYLFTQQLLKLYNEKKNHETLKDLYPKLVAWTSEVQESLSKPEIRSTKSIENNTTPEKTKIVIAFSEPMKKQDTITSLFQDGRSIKKVVDLTVTDNDLKWAEDGMSMTFEIHLPNHWKEHYFQFNWWRLRHPLISEKGVLMKYGTFFKVEK